MALNRKSLYYAINKRNRRVLGINNKTISFRTHERNDKMHENIYMTINTQLSTHKNEMEDQRIEVKCQKMAFLIRLFILGVADEYIDNGAKIVGKYDQDIIKHFKERGEFENYFSTLPKITSFTIREYEKQLFYLKCLINNQIPVIILRYLYHSDMQINIYNINPEKVPSLLHGIDEEMIGEIVQFNEYGGLK